MDKIRVAILDDHQAIIDGYLYRLSGAADIEVVATIYFGADLEPALNKQTVDVLLLDAQVPISVENSNPYPILHVIPRLLQAYPDISILVISMYAQRPLIRAVMEAGASGYVLKDDQASIRELASVIRSIAASGVHLSPVAFQQLARHHTGDLNQLLSTRQAEALSLCAAYPEASTAELARTMNVANSTVRNLLSEAYLKLNVRSRIAAVAKARQLGLITPDVPMLNIQQARRPDE